VDHIEVILDIEVDLHLESTPNSEVIALGIIITIIVLLGVVALVAVVVLEEVVLEEVVLEAAEALGEEVEVSEEVVEVLVEEDDICNDISLKY
jgi:hypothetical protein